MTPEIGEQAPEFTLKSHTLESVSLAQKRGKTVLLLFIPLAFTPT